jgi:hypothetical protein
MIVKQINFILGIDHIGATLRTTAEDEGIIADILVLLRRGVAIDEFIADTATRSPAFLRNQGADGDGVIRQKYGQLRGYADRVIMLCRIL